MAEAEQDDTLQLATAILEGCGAGLGPQIGVELQVGEVELDDEPGALDGDHAVLPIAVLRGDERVAMIEVASPLEEIAGFARRMLGAEEPDAKDEIGQEQLDAIAELLQLMHGAVDEAVRARVDESMRLAPDTWWRTDEPGENALDASDLAIARGTVSVPGGATLQIALRIGAAWSGADAPAPTTGAKDTILLLELDPELRAAMSAALEPSGCLVVEAPAEDEDEESLAGRRAAANVILLSAETEGYLEMCRAIRVADESWQTPLIVCSAEPTRELVVAALHAGGWHVLRVPAEPAEVLRLIELARSVAESGPKTAG